MAKKKHAMISEDTPVCVKPVYATDSVNQPVKLYEGGMELEQGAKTLAGKGSVEFAWLPGPGLRFSLPLEAADPSGLRLDDCVLHLQEMNWHAKASLHRMAVSSSRGLWEVGGLVHEFEIGKGQKVGHVIFHVTNFINFLGRPVRDDNASKTWAARSLTEADDWRITLDKIEGAKPLFDELKATGGYAITHVGKLERLDGKEFNAANSDGIFEVIFRYLSFCRGSWVAPILAVGFDKDGNHVWEQWRNWKIERWINVRTWFSSQTEEGLSQGFPGFYSRWQNAKWKEALLLANHWYVEANMSAGGVEGSIILAQAGFELLAQTYLVEEQRALSENGYENLPAADKLRLLLAACRIPAATPASLPTLTELARANGFQWKDGPHALTDVRNALVHANPAKRKKVFSKHPEIVHEAWELSLRYLELVLLSLCNYKGRHSNRVVGEHWKGEEVERVPWVS